MWNVMQIRTTQNTRGNVAPAAKIRNSNKTTKFFCIKRKWNASLHAESKKRAPRASLIAGRLSALIILYHAR